MNRRFARSLPLDDDRDFELARRGQRAEDSALRIVADEGGIAWDMTTYGFVAGDGPDTVNPSLWPANAISTNTSTIRPFISPISA